ncbi:MAG: gabD4 [Rhodoglobus sp.]|nr:gabD4 [Rhodoglobus sp.]
MTELPLPLGRAAADRLAGRWFAHGDLRRAPSSYELAVPSISGQSLTVGDVDVPGAIEALEAAASSQPAWEATPLARRIAIVRELGRILQQQRTEIAELIVLESGKPLKHARYEVDYALTVLEAMCLASVSLTGSSVVDVASNRAIAVRHRAIGPALLVTPWNFPLSLGLRKVVTALLAGCTLLLKPSELTPLTSVLMGEALAASGLPPGVAAVLPTKDSIGVVDTLLGHPALRKLSFTGSTRVGRELHRRASDQLVRTSLELGGNAPFILGADAPIEAAMPAILAAKFGNSGQACTALNRLYVPRDRVGEVVTALREHVSRLEVGDPWLETTDIGPLITRDAAERVKTLVAGAARDGAAVDASSTPGSQSAQVIVPTIVSGIGSESELASSEIFGPVLPVIAYDGTDDAIAQANATPYGLAAYVWSNDATELDAIVPRLTAGMIAINSGSVSAASSPFGGTGWSGHGRENGSWGLSEFTEVIAVLR